MVLNEVLRLERVSGSIKKIDLFLASVKRNSVEYYRAFCYRNLILHTLNKTNDALKNLYNVVANFPKMEEDSVVAVCDAIIEIAFDIGELDQARKYIDVKKEHLRASNLLLNYVDEIQYQIHLKNYSKAIDLLKEYRNEALGNTETLWCLELLAKLFYETKRFEEYIEVASVLAEIYQDNLNMRALIALHYSKLEISFKEGNYVKVILDGKSLIEEFNCDEETIIKTATLLIECYIKTKDYRKATTVESDYRELIDNVDIDTALRFCEVCARLYRENNFMIFSKNYENKILELKQKKKPAKPFKKKQAFVIPEVFVGESGTFIEEKKETKKEVVIESKEVDTLYVSNQYLKLSNVFLACNKLDANTSFREVFRIALSELASWIDFEEAYILYFYRQYLGIHYKKGRAYDKRPTLESLEDTINYLSILNSMETFLTPDAVSGLRDIVKNEEFLEVPYGFCLPLYQGKKSFASIAFFSKVPFIDKDTVYECLLLVCNMLSRSLSYELSQNEIKNSNRKMFFVYENMQAGIKELVDNDIHLSRQGKEMLGLEREDMKLREYLQCITTEDLPKYEALLKDILKNLTPNQYLEFSVNKNGQMVRIKESFFPYYENGRIAVYSLLEDITLFYNKEKELNELAYTNPVSKLSTEMKLIVDLRDSLNHNKLALAVVDVYDFKFIEELYGINLANQIILFIGEKFQEGLKEYFNATVYHLGFDRYAILFKDMNDKRTIENILTHLFESTSKDINELNRRVKLYFNCGIYRVSKSSNLSDAERVLAYAYEALGDAKSFKAPDMHINHYDSELSKRRFNENELITSISEAIDHGRLSIHYRQVVDVVKKDIFAYYAGITLDSREISEDYMAKVIKRRNLEERIDKYVIQNVSKELKLLNDTLHARLFIIVELSNQTLQKNLPAFIETQNSFFKTTKKNIIFVVEDASNKIVKALRGLGYFIASKNLMNLYHEYLDYYIYDISRNDKERIKEIDELCRKKNATLLLAGVDTKEDVLKALEADVHYVYGGYYKKMKRMQKVIEKQS